MKAQRGGIGVILPFLNLGAVWGWVVNTIPWPLYSHESAPVPIVKKVRWASGLMWMSVESLTPSGFEP
jgi:hypothetical protein